jgi:hypothetical protein
MQMPPTRLRPHDFAGTPQTVDTAEGFYPTTGVNSLTADVSEARGAKVLDGAITGHVGGGNPFELFGPISSSPAF